MRVKDRIRIPITHVFTGFLPKGWCGVSWAVSAVSVLEDRVSIGRGHRVSLDPGPLVQCGRGRVVSRGQECAPGRVETGWHNLQRHGTWSPDCGKDTCDPVTCHVTACQEYSEVWEPPEEETEEESE